MSKVSKSYLYRHRTQTTLKNASLISILILAALLRLFGLGQESLWLDEGFTARRCNESFPALMAEFRVETQGIGYYIIQHFWSRVFGVSEFSLRFPPAIFGILSVWLIFLLARKLLSHPAALGAALLMAASPFAVYYSQDARPYSMFLCAVLCSLYFFTLLMERWTSWRTMVWLGSTMVALYTHPYAPAIVGVFGGMLWIMRWDKRFPEARNRWKQVVALSAVSLVLYLPQLLLQSHSIAEKAAGKGRAAWITRPELTAPASTLAAYFMNRPLAIVVLAILGCLIYLAIRGKPEFRTAAAGSILLIGAFIVAPWAFSLVASPVYVDRYTIPALAGVLMGVAAVTSLTPRWLRTSMLAAYLLVMAYTFANYYRGADKDPWREAAEDVTAIARPGDTVVLLRPFIKDVFTHYYQTESDVKLISSPYGEPLPSELDTAQRIVLVAAYIGTPNALSDSVFARIHRDRTTGDSLVVNSYIVRNPAAYWIARITVTVHDRNLPECPEESVD